MVTTSPLRIGSALGESCSQTSSFSSRNTIFCCSCRRTALIVVVRLTVGLLSNIFPLLNGFDSAGALRWVSGNGKDGCGTGSLGFTRSGTGFVSNFVAGFGVGLSSDGKSRSKQISLSRAFSTWEQSTASCAFAAELTNNIGKQRTSSSDPRTGIQTLHPGSLSRETEPR